MNRLLARVAPDQLFFPLHPGILPFHSTLIPGSSLFPDIWALLKHTVMFISITYIKVKSIWKVPSFFKHVGMINQQIAGAEGVLTTRLKGGLSKNYTITAWESKEAMLNFRNNGAHLEAMKATRHISNEYASCHYEADVLPGWKEALEMVHEKLHSRLKAGA